MKHVLYLLAQHDDGGGIGKVLIWLIPLAIWVIGSILATLQKKKEQERRQRVARGGSVQQRRPAPPAQVPPPLPVPQQRSRRQPQAAQPRRPAERRMRAAESTLRPPPHAPRPPVVSAPIQPPARRSAQGLSISPSSLSPERSTTAPITDPARSVASSSAAPRPATGPAGAIHQWMKPATLRRQFILTELLQPPVALRDRGPESLM